MYLAALIRVNTRMSNLLQTSIINLVNIQSSKSPCQIDNALVLLKKLKTFYLGQVTKQRF